MGRTIYTEDSYYVANQHPLDIKGIFRNIDDMKDPGNGKYEKFYYYYSGMLAIDVSTGSVYIWRERRNSSETGVLDNDFQYSSSIRKDDLYDYTGKKFNFFPINNPNLLNKNDIITGENISIIPGTNQVTVSQLGSNGISDLKVYLNGLRLLEGTGNDYTVDYNTGKITFATNFVDGDILIVDYILNN